MWLLLVGAAGLADAAGMIEAGKVADLIVVSGNSLSNLEALTNLRLVTQGGRVVVGRP